MLTKFYVMSVALLFSLAGACNAHSNQRDTITLDYTVKPWYKYRKDKQPGREVVLRLSKGQFRGKIHVVAECEGKTDTTHFQLAQAQDSLSILLPANAGSKRVAQTRVKLQTATRVWYKTFVVPVKRQWTVYIYPHSHVDIGYTNLQDVVEKLHIRNIDVAIDLAKKTQHYPEGARFVWNPEASWVVSRYLKQADDTQKKNFIEAVRKGWIQVDAAHSNLNTSSCSDEELLRFFQHSNTIESLTGVPITTMVQMDNPGAGWGLVQAAAQNGVNGFISFPNYYDLRFTWDHKPFYWLSQDGKHRIFFLQAASYGWGYRLKGSKYGLGKVQNFSDAYDRLHTDDPLKNFIDPFIFEETAKLEKENSPYDIYAMTWSMADNCLIDADLPEAVKLWNEKYAYPKLIISGAKEIIDAYERRYGTLIPEYQGDFTEFWTNGLGSDARRIGMSRRAKENLIQAETLGTMLHQENSLPLDSINQAWENVLLGAEHTWGYQNPKAPLAKQVEANKAAYFENAEKESKMLIKGALQAISKEGTGKIAVLNTLSWARDGLVELSAAQSKAGDRVVDDAGKEMLSQRLSSGKLIFEAKAIPALSSKLYKILPGKNKQKGHLTVSSTNMQSGLLSVSLDEKTGNISSLIDLKSKHEFVDQSSDVALNSYHYLHGVNNGRDSANQVTTSSGAVIAIKEKGPLMVSLLVKSQAEGCHWLNREIRLIKDQPYVEIINTLDKIATRKKEGVHFGFAFNIPHGITRMDIPFGVMIPDYDQLPAANKNWFTFQRWIDISNKDYGVSWTAIESPLVELGSLTGNILDGARQPWNWEKEVPPTQTLFSWVLNNHWDTNFPLEQGGVLSFCYRILPHEGGYDPVVANRFGVEQNRPLIAVETAKNPIQQALVHVDNPKVMLSTIKESEDGEAWILRLRSLSNREELVNVTWPSGRPKAIFSSTAEEKPLKKAKDSIKLLPYSTMSLRISK